jgi:hypothetical protein
MVAVAVHADAVTDWNTRPTRAVYDGVHFRNSTEVGTTPGRNVRERVAAKVLR